MSIWARRTRRKESTIIHFSIWCPASHLIDTCRSRWHLSLRPKNVKTKVIPNMWDLMAPWNKTQLTSLHCIVQSLNVLQFQRFTQTVSKSSPTVLVCNWRINERKAEAWHQWGHGLCRGFHGWRECFRSYSAHNHYQGVILNPNNKRVYPRYFYQDKYPTSLEVQIYIYLLFIFYLRIYQSAQTTRRRKFQWKKHHI